MSHPLRILLAKNLYYGNNYRLTSRARAMETEFQLPGISKKMIDIMTREGYDACQVSLYSTKSIDVLKRVTSIATDAYLHPDGMIDMVLFKEPVHVLRPTLQNHFINDVHTVWADERPKRVEGNYLQIMYPYCEAIGEDPAETERAAQLAVENCATLISLMHGEFVALELHYSAKVIPATNEFSVQTEGQHVRQTMDDEPLNQAMAKIFDEPDVGCIRKNDAAMSLLRHAHRESNDTTKFLFMWLAIEVIIGNGNERRNFAINTMQSPYLNDQIKFLGSIRNSIVHDGLFVDFSQRNFLKVKCIVLMGLSTEPVTRQRLLLYMENVLPN